jgi:hypothetical protein
MKNNKFLLPIILIVFACVTSSVVAGQLLFKGCLWWNCAPPRSFDVMDLGLPPTLFPANSQYNPIQHNRDDNMEILNSGAQTIYWENGSGLGIYLVDRYATSENAKKEYDRTKNWFFRNGDTKIQWDKYVLLYKSSRADEFYSACGILEADDYRCGMVARYQEFLVFFNTTITDEMTYTDFQNIMVYIDEQMIRYLDG